MAKYTPMIEQYLSIKAEVPDAFLFFRLGDFYEMFFDDAVQASRELEITLTGREGGAEDRIPMCGVPYHSAEGYIARLIEKGYKVAICEQVEDPSEAKGVVRREIVRIVTPGTVMEGRSLQENRNNFIAAAVSADKGMFGFAACDLSTGELYVCRTLLDEVQLADEINLYTPAEVVGDRAGVEAIRSRSALLDRPSVLTERERADGAQSGPLGEEALSGLAEGAAAAVAQLMAYLQETQKRSLAQLTGLRPYEPDQFMTLDPFTRRNLELVETVRERSRKGSLYWLLDKTATSMGSRLLRRWIDKPLRGKPQIEQRLEAVDKLYNQLIQREDLRVQLKDVYDLERLTARIAFGTANARDMIALKRSLDKLPGIREGCVASGSETLRRLAGRLDECADLSASIEEALLEDPPLSVREGGLIRPGHHDYLDQLREANTSGKRWIAELEKAEREATGIKSLKIGFNKVYGYYIEVTRTHLSSLPEGRYERKQTLANAERFITPELKEKEALILEAEEKMVGLEYELFARLREQIARHTKRLQELAAVVAEVDVLQSLATVSASQRFVKPDISLDFTLSIEEGRHPVVEAVMKDDTFIANDTDMTPDDGRVLLITGPNMAGKSTYMRQVALICIMAQIGCFVPARRAVIPLIDRIFTRIGAADDLIGGQSTFMVEMMDIQLMTAKATERSLVIIDELGRGTSTGEGMAIAQAVIEYMYGRIGCKTLVSTHFHELAHLEDSLAALRNHCMAVKESGQQVTFLRKLVRGAAGTSYGIYCAQIAGLPPSIIDRAYALLHTFEEKVSGPRESGKEAGAAVLEAAAASETGAVPSAASAGAVAAVPGPAGSAVHHAAAEQLSLFDEAALPSATGRKRQEEQVLDRLKGMDLMNTTPLQAIQVLYELKTKLTGSRG